MIKNGINYWSTSSKIIKSQANSMGYDINVIDYNDNLFYIEKNGNKIYFKNIDCGLNNTFGFKIAQNKELTYKLFDTFGLPVPKSFYFRRGDVIDFVYLNEQLDGMIVVKPQDAWHGLGVTVGVNDIDSFNYAVENAFKYSDNIIVQKIILGDDYRIIFIDGKLIAGTLRQPPFVIGDGKSTIMKLIEDENIANRSKECLDITHKQIHGGETISDDDIISCIKPIVVDNELIECLNQQELGLESVLSKNEKIFVRRNGNVSTGGLSIECTDIIDNSYVKIGKLIFEKTGLSVFGLDVFTSNIEVPIDKTGGAILEINATPGIRMHHFPFIGKSKNIAKKIIELAEKNIGLI